jgi:hypothetical protein
MRDSLFVSYKEKAIRLSRMPLEQQQPQPQKPIGELKTLLSLVDRTDFDEFVYPADCSGTVFQPRADPYVQYVQESTVWPFSGRPAWGQRVTFDVPRPWEADFLHWIALRLQPLSWLSAEVQRNIQNGVYFLYDPASAWIWASSLGTAAIALAEMEVDGVVVERFSGDWLTVWNATHHTVSEGVGWDELYGSHGPPSYLDFVPNEDGYVYCMLPFWFTKFLNTAFPLVSCSQQVRFHITLRPFSEVVRMVSTPKACIATASGSSFAYTEATPLGTSFSYRDYSYQFNKSGTYTISSTTPGFSGADMLCGISQLDTDARAPYFTKPHELMMNPVTESVFAEPLKYVVNRGIDGLVTIKLPLTDCNGPLKQLLFFVRRKDAITKYNDWTAFGAVLPADVDPVFAPQKPLLQHAQLMVGTAVFADEDEDWWRSAGNVVMPGGIRGYGNYVYAYNFAEKPVAFSPSGSVNAGRVDLWLTLTVAPPVGVEWTVTVFSVSTNWMRFENGLANQVFSD